jgi:hypothetical protein
MPLWGSFVRAYHKPTTSAPLIAAAIDTCKHQQQQHQQQQPLKSVVQAKPAGSRGLLSASAAVAYLFAASWHSWSLL